jgi:hypothetical protein
LLGEIRTRSFQPGSILGEKVFEFAAVVAGADEKVVPGPWIEFHDGQTR